MVNKDEDVINLVLNKKDVIFDDLRNLNIEKCGKVLAPQAKEF